MVVCPECGRRCTDEHGYRSHWGQSHARPGRVRAYSIPAAMFTPEAELMMARVHAARLVERARRRQASGPETAP